MRFLRRYNFKCDLNRQRADYYEDKYWQTIPISIRSFALIVTNGSEIYQISRQENGTCSNKPITYGLNRDMLVCILDHVSAFYGTLMPGNAMTFVVIPKALNISIEAFSLLTLR